MNPRLQKAILLAEMEEKGITQKELALGTGYSESRVSQLLNIEKPPRQFMIAAASFLDSIRLQYVIRGTIINPVYLNQIRDDFQTVMDRTRVENEETNKVIGAIKQLHNARSYKDCTRDQQRQIEEVVRQKIDDIIAGQHLLIAAKEFGVEVREAIKECNLKYIDRGYTSGKGTIKKDTCSPQASVSM